MKHNMYREDEDDTEDIERCIQCGGEVAIVETDTSFPYGTEAIEIPVTLDVRVCYTCDEAYCCADAEEAKQHAINEYLKNEKSYKENLAESQAEVERLQDIISRIVWVQPRYNGSPSCSWCGNQMHWGHTETCNLREFDQEVEIKD